MYSKNELNLLRNQIQDVDDELVHLLERRMRLSQAIGRYKAANELPIYDPIREAKLQQHLIEQIENPVHIPYVNSIVKEWLKQSKHIQSGKKILFTDLDGTLLNDQKEIPKQNQIEIKKAIENGHIVTVATGRTFESALNVVEKLGLNIPGCYLICYNGAMVYDFQQKKALIDIRLNKDQVAYLFEEAYAYQLYIQTYQNGKIWTKFDCDELKHYQNASKLDKELHEAVVQELVQEPHKVVLIDFQKEKLQQFQVDHREWEEKNCLSLFSCDEYLEYCPFGATKGEALKFIASYLNVPIENTIAVGDEENDISMILAAGCGIAMGNAKDEVKEIANYITLSNNDCGVAKVLSIFFGELESE